MELFPLFSEAGAEQQELKTHSVFIILWIGSVIDTLAKVEKKSKLKDKKKAQNTKNELTEYMGLSPFFSRTKNVYALCYLNAHFYFNSYVLFLFLATRGTYHRHWYLGG
jgi:hypothetical protein